MSPVDDTFYLKGMKMTKKEKIARAMGTYLETQDWSVFESQGTCEECHHKYPHNARYCPHCGTRTTLKEDQEGMIEVLYQAYVIGKRTETIFDKLKKS
jgi:RNA polymerase subunit RPABC4/transcription elongation factor Spt4